MYRVHYTFGVSPLLGVRVLLCFAVASLLLRCVSLAVVYWHEIQALGAA